ncbi:MULTISPECIES: phosphatidate cytidylyltransferase [unclassified Neisseria]|uniref:phosphatidate cytidylyltransferase n=1 Tax=unclassified Neisseria TaxID=2623750 RepID=UPI0026665045|nr:MULTISPECIES: phosphatidate cytidylyltransferase [unclassified Neisseria]MDO1509793.1 phosphatidate cytidylyltransferase [Neisseria sp. MVDL19-042950]MDO1515883.1 phosphatidate cytidylyltransferase [Neisseria sp. MVDL18-041461]MDO1562996.1 phosphatidate cytidylyltransferase [Neisseria sp. MVDL20-010259]
MLKQRIITALVLLPLMLGMLFYASDGLWAAFSGLIALVALWEYGRMAGFTPAQNNHYLAATAVFGLVAYLGDWALPSLVWLVVLVFWLVLVPLWLRGKWTLPSGWQAYTVGWLLMVSFWFALVMLRPDVDAAVSLLAVMGLVWVADIFAYFCGKAFGKRKLAPAISPGKSWEGALGGALCVAVYMTLVWNAGWLAFEVSWFGAIMVGLLLTVVSIVGDLLESWLKRSAGIKDSSDLLPGHGGVFDRVDSLIAVLSVYAAIMMVFA